ncbi:MAG: hypothetical protein OXN89_21320, partial [Bryobacterales bacterium]|nr:hypothetical protein [Bryobacterales bacterium]
LPVGRRARRGRGFGASTISAPARGEHGSESAGDSALVYEGRLPSLDSLPRTLEDRDMDWAPIERSSTLRCLNVCRTQHSVPADGRRLHGIPLPGTARKDVSSSDFYSRPYFTQFRQL